jgi:peptide/nickel transport system permease protein
MGRIRQTKNLKGQVALPGSAGRLERLYPILLSLCRNQISLLAFVFLVALLVAAAIGPSLIPDEWTRAQLRYRNLPPFTNLDMAPLWLGTDQLGRSMVYRLLQAARVSLTVGLSTVLISGTFGTILGLAAGYYGKRVEDVLMRLVDLQMAFPGLLLAMLVLAAAGPGFINVILVLSFTHWALFARTSRGVTLYLRETPFIEATRVIGCSAPRTIFRHLLPNVMPPVLTIATLEIARVVLSEASLSFLGLGVQPPQSSWGLMLAQGEEYITTAWWLMAFPGLAILLTTLSINLLASWLITISDPTQRWRLIK